MTDDTPPVLYISADTSDLTTRYKATPRMHMGAEVWIPRDAVRVKPLEWGSPLAGFHPAILPFGGKMEIMWDQVHGVETFILHPGTQHRRHFPTLEAAKAAAQADYEARILAALETTDGQ